MTIEKGRAWGAAGPLPPEGVVVASDGEASRVIAEARARRQPLPVLGLIGGDLYRTVGGRDFEGFNGSVSGGGVERLRSEDAITFLVDLGEVLVNGRIHLFVAHVIAHSRLWRRSFAALNAQWRGDWDLGPRAHPNDGLLDVYEAQLTFSDLWKVRARLPTGSHLPHPGIKQRRVRSVQVEFDHPLQVEVDGVAVGSARALSIRLEPDALTIVA